MIPHHEWLDEAKRLCVGERKRVYHGAETRPNMLIQNTPTAYKAWCWHCNAGGAVRKEYSRAYDLEHKTSSTTRDYSFASIAELQTKDVQRYKDLLCFLQSKGMSLVLLKPYIKGFDMQSNRLVLHCGTSDDAALLGRAIYPSNAKWLTYKRGVAVYTANTKTVCITEDNFSAIKLHHVLRCTALALNGTKLTHEMLVHLLDKQVILHLDADEAGQRGATKIKRQLTALGQNCVVLQAPEPKELNQQQIRGLYGHLLTEAMP